MNRHSNLRRSSTTHVGLNHDLYLPDYSSPVVKGLVVFKLDYNASRPASRETTHDE